ncbi:MAG: CDP-alcohol phosphatidyltransferase family protein [Halofilum sp. (in: g-proteobacteria)]|nr:CDP-alcohol phosphatidyltransferase family protein [Halofilum sp. (in: g-proteobacteria)]
MIRHLPNVLSALRLASVPALLLLAWHGQPLAFLGLLLVSVLSDALDGWIARRFDAITKLGIRLDSTADFALYVAVPLGGWWLWPELLLREAPWIALIIVGYALPGALALLRFHRLSSYHTWSAKLAVALSAAGLFVLFAFELPWLLYIGAPLALLAGLEQSLITLLAAGPRDNIPTLWHALRSGGER